MPLYDLAAGPAAASLSDAGFGHLICRTPFIWLGALMLGVLVGGALALTNPLAYSATGLLLGLGSDETVAQDEIAIIRSDEVVRGIVDRLGLLRVAPNCVAEGALATACAAKSVRAQTQGRIVGDPNGIQDGLMMRLTAVNPDPVIAVAMLDAAVALDREIWHAAHLPDRAETLDPQLAIAQDALDHTFAEMARIRAQAGVTDIEQDLVHASAETAAFVRQDGELRLRQAAVDAELQASSNALQTTPETVLDSREVSSGDSGQESRALLLQLKLQRAHMVELYAPDYPGLAELDRKIQTIEIAMRTQAKSTTAIVRDVRNPILTVLATKIAVLEAESAGLVQQRQELQRQLRLASTHEANLRDAQRRLSMLQQRQGTQEAVVRQLTTAMTNLRAQDVLTTAHLSQRRLMQRPVAVVVPWTGGAAAALIGTVTCLVYGLTLSLLAWRRRSFHVVERTLPEPLEKSGWMKGAVAKSPQLVVVPLPQSFNAHKAPTLAPVGLVPASGSLASALQTAASIRMFASRRQPDIESSELIGEDAALPNKASG